MRSGAQDYHTHDFSSKSERQGRSILARSICPGTPKVTSRCQVIGRTGFTRTQNVIQWTCGKPLTDLSGVEPFQPVGHLPEDADAVDVQTRVLGWTVDLLFQGAHCQFHGYVAKINIFLHMVVPVGDTAITSW